MKKYLSILPVLFLGMALSAQTLLPTTVVNAGGSAENPNLGSVQWTLGELIVETQSSADNSLSHGFMFSGYDIETLVDNVANNIEMQIYPNPASDFIVLKTDTESMRTHENLLVLIFDMQGKLVLESAMDSDTKTIPLQNFNNSMYIVKLMNNNDLLQSFKILKSE